MKLRNTEKFVDILEFDISRGQINRSDIDRDSKLKTNGFFCEVQSHIMGLGVSDGVILVIVDGKAYSSEVITTTCLPASSGKELCVYKNREILFTLSYMPNEPQWNFFTEEDEDVDPLLLMHNILSSSVRKSIFVENN